MYASFRSAYAQTQTPDFVGVPACLASWPFVQFSFQTHLLCLFLPRTDRSHLPVDITSFHTFAPNLPMHPWRIFLQKAAKA